jgi:hypothetical protein
VADQGLRRVEEKVSHEGGVFVRRDTSARGATHKACGDHAATNVCE